MQTAPTIPPQKVEIASIYALVEADLLKVKDSLEAIVTPQTQHLAESIAQTLGTQGKLFRPLLSLLMSRALGDINDRHIETSAVAELIHVATLLHDDVLDESDMRRGKKTIRSQWGNKVSILSGDYLLAQASLKLSKLNNCRLVGIFSEVLSNLCDGEVEQSASSYSLNPSWESYFTKTRFKTASLFAACGEAAGVNFDLPEPEIQRLRSFGEKFGVAFQIMDDILDFTASAEELGKPVLDDLRNGIINAPVLYLLEAVDGHPEQQVEVTSILSTLFNTPHDAVPPQELVERLHQLLSEHHCLDKTLSLAQTYCSEACEALSFVPASPYREALETLTAFALQRRK